MAIELCEGEYALQQDAPKKTVLQLKLTDSALRAIEVFQEELGGRRLQPSIQFDGSQGSIRIPTEDGNENQTFTFQLASLTQSAAIDCVQQYHTRESRGRVSFLGGIQQKITINANDDSYNTTRKRMTLAKEQEQKISTKVIKQPSTSKIRKKNLLHRQILDQHGRNSTASPNRTSSNHSFTRSASPLTTSSMKSVSPISSGGDLAGVRNKTKPILSSTFSSAAPSSQQSASSKKPFPPAKLLHERIVHILAVKPLKQSEILNRLARFEQSPPDRTKLMSVLQQVATSRSISPGVQEYTLNRTFMNDVNPEWNGFNSDEKQIVFKKKQGETSNRKRAITSPDTTPKDFPAKSMQEENYTNPVKKKARVSHLSKASPNSTVPGRPRSVSPLESAVMPSLNDSIPLSINSSSVVELDDSNISGLVGLSETGSSRRKSPKALHDTTEGSHKKFSGNGNRRNRPGYSPSRSMRHSPGEMPINNTLNSTSSSTVNSKRSSEERYDTNSVSPNQSDERSHSDGDVGMETGKQRRRTDPSSKSDNYSTSKSRHKLHFTTSKETALAEEDEFARKYPAIDYVEQRDQYKSAFYAEYKEYRRLHEKVAAESEKFGKWKGELDQLEKGTQRYKHIVRQVYAEYHKLKKDKVYCRDRERMQYLHRKLKHIKDVVNDFDCRQFEQNIKRNRDERRAMVTA